MKAKKQTESGRILAELRKISGLLEAMLLAIVPPADADAPSDGAEKGNERIEALYVEAKQLTINAGHASTSYLQRVLNIGYAKAALLMDMLEERGIVSPKIGDMERRVLVPKKLTQEVIKTLAGIESQLKKKRKKK